MLGKIPVQSPGRVQGREQRLLRFRVLTLNGDLGSRTARFCVELPSVFKCEVVFHVGLTDKRWASALRSKVAFADSVASGHGQFHHSETLLPRQDDKSGWDKDFATSD